jgi:hypothetical protein
MPGPLRCWSSALHGPLDDAAGSFACGLIAIEEGMRKLLLLIALLPGVAVASAASANDLPKNTQPKPKAPQATANPCAQYGTGFVQVPGTQTCVRTNGSVRTDYTTSGRAR